MSVSGRRLEVLAELEDFRVTDMDPVVASNRFPGSTTWRFDACSVNIWSKILILTVCQHWASIDMSQRVSHLFSFKWLISKNVSGLEGDVVV